jgi:hypothetical protein
MGSQYIQSNNPGDYVQTSFYGAGLWGYIRGGPDAGDIDISVDGIVTVSDVPLVKSNAQRIPVWVAVGLTITDTKGKPVVHTVRLTIRSNTGGSDKFLRIEGFEVEVEAGALQTLSFIEQDLSTITTAPTPTPTGVLMEVNAVLPFNDSISSVGYGAVATANVNVLSVSLSLPVTRDVLVAGFVKAANACVVYLLRDGAIVTSGTLSAGGYALIAAVDKSVGAGNHSYSIQFSVSGNVAANLVAVDGGLSNEADASTDTAGTANFIGSTDVSSGAGPQTVSKTITLSVSGSVLICCCHMAQNMGATASIAVKRGSTTLTTLTLPSGGNGNVETYLDSGLAAGTYTYSATYTGQTTTSNVVGDLLLITNAG